MMEEFARLLRLRFNEKNLRMLERGGNLAGVISSRFLNHPLIASAKVVGVVIVFISAVIAAYAGLRGLFG